MIAQAKKDYEHKSFFFLLWGWLLLLTGVGHFVLSKAGYGMEANWLWFIQGIIGGIISALYSARNNSRTGNVDSHMNQIIAYMWIGFGITLFFVIFGTVQAGINPIPFVLLVTGLPTFLSGRILKFAPLTWGGICFWIFGMVSLYAPIEYTTLIFSAAILAGYLIPGYALRQNEKRRSSV